MRLLLTLFLSALLALSAAAQTVTVHAVDKPAADLFRELIEESGLNFVYSSDLLKDMRVTVSADAKPLRQVLDEIFAGTDIGYRIKGRNVILKRRRRVAKPVTPTPPRPVACQPTPDTLKTALLREVVVLSRLEAPEVETTEIGARKVTADEVRSTPSLFGESDVIKALQTRAGVSAGTEGLAGMYVHGGNADENLYMLDNVPLYQVNHFAGLFSAFNTDIIRYIDFFKSSMPAKYDGRLSSFMDVRLLSGHRDGHHGSARLGLTSGAFNISGPIGSRTTYLVGVRRSWFDLLTMPALALINSSEDEKIHFNYYFMDLNAKVTHRFSDRMTAFASVYFGDDRLKTGYEEDDAAYGYAEDDRYTMHWGNLVVQAGLNYRFTPAVSAEFTAAYTRYFSSMDHDYRYTWTDRDGSTSTSETVDTDNNINDWIFRGDFLWRPDDASRVRFGAGYVRHSFLPSRTMRRYTVDATQLVSRDSTRAYGADELNAYIEDDLRLNDRFSINAGLHLSLFNIDRRVRHGLSPRLSAAWRPGDDWAVKAAYSRTVQYVHQLTQSYLSLPTDRWIPVTGRFKPQTADKVSAGIYYRFPSGDYELSAEGYFKWMHHLIDYRDEYYLQPPLEMWDARLTSGRGTARGVDINIGKVAGRLTGHISYSLAWADRTFADKNGGLTFPARIDNRHTINLLLNWRVSDRVSLNAAWTGHSGNRFTLMPQVWSTPGFGTDSSFEGDVVPLRTPLNNYRLPFYHRLDLSCTVTNSRGYWTFSLFNAYNHMNTVALRRAYRESFTMAPDGTVSHTSRPVFQRVKLLPIIPSISYTWQF